LSKFNLDLKIEAIHQYLSRNEGIKSIAKSLGINHEILRMWIKQYEYHGLKAFEKTYTAYSLTYKLDVLNYMNENGIDALKPKIKGRHRMTDKNKKGLQKQEPAEGSVEALQAELERLRMENAYLKKLNALVQNKEKSPNKTKRKSSMN